MLKSIFSLPADLYKNRRLVMKLAKNDFKTRYAGSYFGTIWAFVQPIVTILVYWFVFSVGFRSQMSWESHLCFIWLQEWFPGFSFLMHFQEEPMR